MVEVKAIEEVNDLICASENMFLLQVVRESKRWKSLKRLFLYFAYFTSMYS